MLGSGRKPNAQKALCAASPPDTELHPTTLGALVVVLESIVFGTFAVVAGTSMFEAVFPFWATISLAFAPSWLLGSWIANVGPRGRLQQDQV